MTEPSKTDQKRYLGDGVYADFDGFHVIVFTSDGVSAHNIVYLEDTVASELIRYIGDKFRFVTNEDSR